MRVLIVDDESAARRRLKKLTEELHHTVVAEAADGEQALNMAREYEPDLILLDVAMPGMDGLEVATKLHQMQVSSALVFVTAHDEYAVEAFDREAQDYLLKPVRRERLERALERVSRHEPVSRGDRQEAHQLVRKGRSVQRLSLQDIWFFKAEDKVVLAFDGEQEHLIEPSLKQLEELYGDHFIRIHRAYLVDAHRMQRLERDVLGGTLLWLKGYDQPLPVSRRMLARVRAAMSY